MLPRNGPSGLTFCYVFLTTLVRRWAIDTSRKVGAVVLNVEHGYMQQRYSLMLPGWTNKTIKKVKNHYFECLKQALNTAFHESF